MTYMPDVMTMDTTENDVSTSFHGLVPKAPGDSGYFLRGDGTWAPLVMVIDQLVSSTRWEIQHNLKRFPSVTLVDSSGSEFDAEVEHIDNNNLVVTLSSPTSGKVFLN